MTSRMNERPVPNWIGFASGAIAAMAAGAVTHPIDLVKVRMQLYGAKDGFEYGSSHVDPNKRPPGFIRTLLRVARGEGAPALYKGLSASLLRQASFIGTKFGVYDVLKVYAPLETDGQLSFASKVVCGMLAGAAGAVVGNPADLAMVRMQADGRLPADRRRNYRNGAQAMWRVSREEGVTALWRGSAPTVARAVVITASQLAVYDQIKGSLLNQHQFLAEGPLLHVSSSVVCSLVASVTSNPFDVVKSRLQQMKVRTRDGRYPYRGMVDCFVKTVRMEGPLALYKGLVPTAARQLPLNIVRFVCVEQLRRLFVQLNDNVLDPLPAVEGH